MAQTTRTTKLLLDLGPRTGGGANAGKQAYLEATAAILNAARAFYVAFLLAHRVNLSERVCYFSEKRQQERERAISADELLTWAEVQTVATSDHPEPLPDWNFSQAFPGMPFIYRRSVIKDAIGKARSYLSNLANWQQSGRKKGKPGLPGTSNHPTLYEGVLSLELSGIDLQQSFVRLKVYTGQSWAWFNYPVKYNRYFEARRTEPGWREQSPRLILRRQSTELHFPQAKEIRAKKVKESKLDPALVTVAVDLNVKNLAVVTVRQHEKIVESVFIKDRGLDQHRYRHLKHISRKQWLSGKPVKGERNCASLWRHIRRMNTDTAHRTARAIARICAKYPGCVLVFERLRKIKARGDSKSRRLNRKQSNQLRGQINQLSREKVFAQTMVTIEVNPEGPSQYCSRCGAKGERFSLRASHRVKERGGKLFRCLACGHEAHADHNASVNLHHSFYRELHWQAKPKSTINGGHSP